MPNPTNTHSPLRDDYTSNNIRDDNNNEDSDGDEPVAAMYGQQTTRASRRLPSRKKIIKHIRRRINNSPTTQTTTNNNTNNTTAIDFDTRNNEYVPQLIDNLPPPPQRSVEKITKVLVALGCDTPRRYQIDSIFQLTYRKLDMMYLIRKCGDGKSLVMHAMATILRGIIILYVDNWSRYIVAQYRYHHFSLYHSQTLVEQEPSSFYHQPI